MTPPLQIGTHHTIQNNVEYFDLSQFWLSVMEYLCHKWPRICSTCRNSSRSFPHSWLITGFVTILIRQVSLVEQELPTLPEHLSSPLFSGVRCTRSLVLYVCFVDRWLSFFFWPLCCLFFFDIRIFITLLVSSNSSLFILVQLYVI